MKNIASPQTNKYNTVERLMNFIQQNNNDQHNPQSYPHNKCYSFHSQQKRTFLLPKQNQNLNNFNYNTVIKYVQNPYTKPHYKHREASKNIFPTLNHKSQDNQLQHIYYSKSVNQLKFKTQLPNLVLSLKLQSPSQQSIKTKPNKKQLIPKIQSIEPNIPPAKIKFISKQSRYIHQQRQKWNQIQCDRWQSLQLQQQNHIQDFIDTEN